MNPQCVAHVQGCKGDDCSMEKDPASWDGFPGCDADANAAGAPPPPGAPPSPGWQLCPALGFGQLMSMLPNSTAGLQWSDKWQQNYFNVPPGIYPNKRTNASGVSATIWIDTAKSLAPKYKWAIEKCGGFGICKPHANARAAWAHGLSSNVACRDGGHGGRGGRQGQRRRGGQGYVGRNSLAVRRRDVTMCERVRRAVKLTTRHDVDSVKSTLFCAF